MNMLVCIKEVPKVSEMKIDRETNNLIRDGVPMIINPPDMNALEEALKIKAEHGGEVTVLTMGLPSATESLRACIAIGADKGVLLSDRALAGSDTLATSYALAKAIESLGDFDIVFTGTQAIDGDTGQVGSEIAENLGISQVSYVKSVEVEDGNLILARDYNNGVERIKTSLPALITVTRDANTPRKPSIKTKTKANKAEFTVLDCAAAGIDPNKVGVTGSGTAVVEVYPPVEREKGVLIQEASEEESVQKLVQILVSEKLF